MTTVACIIPHYKQLSTLRRAIESALSQCDEVMVVDDGTPDIDVRAAFWDIYIAQKTLPLRLKYWVSGVNQGVCRTRNIAAALTTADYILPLDADDWLAPGAVAKFRPFLTGHDYVYGDWLDEPAGTYRNAAPIEKLLDKNVAKATFFISREAFQSVKGYDHDFEAIGAEDWALMLALAHAGYKGARVPMPLYHYTTHATGRAILPRQNEAAIRDLIAQKYGVAHARP